MVDTIGIPCAEGVMPWSTRSTVEARLQLIRLVEAGEPIAAAARECGVSRPTAYKWLERYRENGEEGLEDRSTAPHSIPHRTPRSVVEKCLQVRRQYPTWGPKKIRAWLRLKEPGIDWPAVSTIGYWLDKAGLVERRRYRVRTPRATEPLVHAVEPNDVWSIDFKGQFRLGNGRYCYPLTVTDNATRYILGITALTSTHAEPVAAVMHELFARYGLPKRIRSDNGTPFVTQGTAGLSKVNVVWLAHGIRHERIRPGKPQENGRHERMHLTLKQETARPPCFTLAQQQERFELFIDYFNNQRPHEALEQVTPGSAYAPSPRRAGEELELEYECDLVQYVRAAGSIRLWGTNIHISEALVGYPVGLTELEEDVWLCHFAHVSLGLLERGDTKLTKLDHI